MRKSQWWGKIKGWGEEEHKRVKECGWACRGEMRHATFTRSLCIANHAYVMRPSSFMQIVWVPQQCLIHIHAAGGTWHLSAGRLVTLNLCVNVEHMQRGQGNYACADEMLFPKVRLEEKWLAMKVLNIHMFDFEWLYRMCKYFNEDRAGFFHIFKYSLCLIWI